MKKTFKIIGITLGSILGVAVVAIIVVCNIVFSAKTLTPIIRNNVGRFITCEADLDTADLTFFSTFPHFSLHATNVSLVNPMENAPCDTLVYIDDVTATLDVWAFLFDNSIILNDFTLTNATACIYVDSMGRANYDIVPPSETEEEETTSSIFDLLQLESIKIDNLSARYVDRTMGVDAAVKNLGAYVYGQLQGADGEIYTDILINDIMLDYQDSTAIYGHIIEPRLTAAGTLRDNHFDGKVQLKLPDNTVVIDNDTLLRRLPVSLELPAEMNFDLMHANLHHATLDIAGQQIILDGPVQMQDEKINMDVTFATNKWDIEELIALIPESYADALEGITVSGKAELDGSVKGTYSGDSLASSMPLVAATLKYSNGRVAYPEVIPYKLHDVTAEVSADMNLNDGGISNATIHNISAKTGTMQVSAKGTAKDLMGNINCDLKVAADINLPELKPLLPEDLAVDMNGRAKADIAAAFKLNDITSGKYEKIKVNGTIRYTDLDVLYKDSIHITDPEGTIALELPSPVTNKTFKEFAQVSVAASDLALSMLGTLDARIGKPEITLGVSNPLDTTSMLSARCNFEMVALSGNMDTINFDIAKPSGSLSLHPSKRDPKMPIMAVTYASDAIKANMGSLLDIDTKKINMKVASAYDEKGENMFLKLNPMFTVDFNDGKVRYADIPAEIQIPAIKFKFRPNNFDIEKSHIIIQHSDFNLSGKITNLRRYMKNQGLLKGELQFISHNTNIDELMALASGFGNDSIEVEEVSEQTAQAESCTTTAEEEEPNPFMVPKGVDLAFVTNIHHATFGGTKLDSVGGKLTIKDGVAIAEQMGFTTNAAEMQLTGMYRSDRRNHLFAGIDFHLLNVDIKELIDMIPAIDTIVPMLKTFEGRAEFHIAAETYLNARYEPKLSTLRAAAALEGKDLVLLDNETFSTIAKYMMFNKKTRNVVDSISVEMTVFRNEIDLYPFLISMDKWQAVLSGRHNLDMSFNYHISLTDCPLPVRLGLDVKGTLDNLKFNLAPCKYKALYKPDKQKVTDKQTLALKKMISDALKSNVK